jgi:hypothetical protein
MILRQKILFFPIRPGQPETAPGQPGTARVLEIPPVYWNIVRGERAGCPLPLWIRPWTVFINAYNVLCFSADDRGHCST